MAVPSHNLCCHPERSEGSVFCSHQTVFAAKPDAHTHANQSNFAFPETSRIIKPLSATLLQHWNASASRLWRRSAFSLFAQVGIHGYDSLVEAGPLGIYRRTGLRTPDCTAAGAVARSKTHFRETETAF